MARIITIKVQDECMETSEGRLPKSRLVWAAQGALEVYVRGPLGGKRYEQAASLALQLCVEMHIPCISLRSQK